MFKSVIVWGPVSPGVAGVPGDMGRTFILPGWREIKVLDPLKVGVNLLDSLNIMFLFVWYFNWLTRSATLSKKGLTRMFIYIYNVHMFGIYLFLYHIIHKKHECVCVYMSL